MPFEYGLAPIINQTGWGFNPAGTDWYRSAMQNAGGGNSYGGTTPVNTAAVGGDIGKYNLSAIAGDPRLNSIMRNIEGNVPSDLKRKIELAAAERGIGIGAPTSANANTAYLQALGLTTYDLMNKGVEQYRDLVSGIPKLDPTSLFVSPSQQASEALKRQLQTEALQAEAARQAENNAAASIRQAAGYSASAAQQANELGFKRSVLDAENARRAATSAATARQIDSILNRFSSGWGGNDFTPIGQNNNDPWSGTGSGDFFSYLDNLDPNLLGGSGVVSGNGGFQRDFSVEDGLTGSSGYGAPAGYSFENYGSPSEDYGASGLADFNYFADTLTGDY